MLQPCAERIEAAGDAQQCQHGLAAAIAAGVTLISVHGTADKVVPYVDNAARVVELWQRQGGRVHLFAKEGGDHHPHGLPDPTPLVDLLLATAR